MKHHFLIRAIALSAVVGLVGCGEDSPGRAVTASGTVTYDGKPLSKASIRFTSHQSGATSVADLKPDGTYMLELPEATTEEVYGVSIGPPVETGDGPVELDAAGLPKQPEPPSIPPRYFEYTTSGLTATVGLESEQSFDFQLGG